MALVQMRHRDYLEQEQADLRTGRAKLLVVAVCTYKRPKMLGNCLSSLADQELRPGQVMQIVVVDNDRENSGFLPYCEFVKFAPYYSDYLCEVKRGIAAARNAAVRYARERNADWLAFIDDDAIANKDWAAQLLHPDFAHVPIVGGANVMVYGDDIPEWAKPRQKDRLKATGSVTGGNNLRIDMAIFDRIQFDEALGLGGGEDGDFLARAQLAGFGKAHNAKAFTFEDAHKERYKVRGLIYRAYWIAAANMREEITKAGKLPAIFKRAPQIATAPFGSLIYLAVGLSRLPARPDEGKRKLLQAGKAIAIAIGRIAGIIGHIPQAYRKTVGR